MSILLLLFASFYEVVRVSTDRARKSSSLIHDILSALTMATCALSRATSSNTVNNFWNASGILISVSVAIKYVVVATTTNSEIVRNSSNLVRRFVFNRGVI